MGVGTLTFVTDEGIGPAELGQALEQRGFESLFLAEHTHIPVGDITPYPAGGPIPPKYYRTLDPFVALTAAAVATGRLVLGTGIALVPQRDPIHTAKEVASLDLLSRGRFRFGVGVGWLREEIANHGVDPGVRGRVVDERLDAMIQIWTHEKRNSMAQFVNFDPIYSWPKPVEHALSAAVLWRRPRRLQTHRPAACRLAVDDTISGSFGASTGATTRRGRPGRTGDQLSWRRADGQRA